MNDLDNKQNKNGTVLGNENLAENAIKQSKVLDENNTLLLKNVLRAENRSDDDTRNFFRHLSPNESPGQRLHQIAAAYGSTVDDEKFSLLMDQLDPVGHLRKEIFYPKMKDLPHVDLKLVNPDDDAIYLCGNSLGLQPKGVDKYIQRELDKWAKMGVYGHFKADLPWNRCDEFTLEGHAKIVGAKSVEEIAVMNGLSVNLHLLMVSFYRPTKERYKILMEHKAFPSDHFVVESQLRFHGYDPAEGLIVVQPREGEHCLRPQDVMDCIENRGSEIALVLLSGVQYYTGQLFDVEGITQHARSKGCVIGWDMAHAAGNVPLKLHDWQVDFAAWCSYKYMNCGCGGLSGVFVHEKHANNTYPKFSGWWSDDKMYRMQMTNVLHLTPGAAGYRISNPPFLLVCPMLASLDIFSMTNMDELRRKSVLLTGYLEMLLDTFLARQSPRRTTREYCEIVTPRQPEQRGCQLSLKFSVELNRVFEQLEKRGVVCDKRLPFVLRVAPIHIYNSFHDVRRFVTALIDSLTACE